jgi:predicted metal-dependent HD superfamily phosphohydrolase
VPGAERARWDAAWRTAGARPPDALFAELAARYDEPHRAYHTRRHLAECFVAFDPVAGQAERPAEIELALWFHDAIYDPKSDRNEDESAAWAERALAAGGAPATASARVRDLVLATKHAAEPADPDAKLLVDVDLAILGAEPGRFAEYETQIRFEYAWVPEPAYRAGRARVLAGFLARPAIYATRDFAGRLEARARANLAASIERLQSTDR